MLALTGWAGSARVLRGFTLSLRGRDYVLAARVSGERSWRILAVEILPNLIPLLASQVVFAIIFAILGEAGLSFLGLGASGSFTWGTMLFYAQNGLALRLGAWWWFVPPGLLLALFGAALSLINFSIDEVINPKLRAQTRADRKKLVDVPRAAQGRCGGHRMSAPTTTAPAATTVSRHAVLTIDDLSVDYLVDPPVHAVDHVSLELRRGEILGLAGESGCGKIDPRLRDQPPAQGRRPSSRRLGDLPLPERLRRRPVDAQRQRPARVPLGQGRRWCSRGR